MNWYSILQSIITWGLTTFAVACATWSAKISKRITILEEHDKSQQLILETLQTSGIATSAKLDNIQTSITTLATKLDLILEGRVVIGQNRRISDRRE